MKRHIIFPLLGLLLGGGWAVATELGIGQTELPEHYRPNPAVAQCQECNPITAPGPGEDPYTCSTTNTSGVRCECFILDGETPVNQFATTLSGCVSLWKNYSSSR